MMASFQFCERYKLRQFSQDSKQMKPRSGCAGRTLRLQRSAESQSAVRLQSGSHGSRNFAVCRASAGSIKYPRRGTSGRLLAQHGSVSESSAIFCKCFGSDRPLRFSSCRAHQLERGRQESFHCLSHSFKLTECANLTHHQLSWGDSCIGH